MNLKNAFKLPTVQPLSSQQRSIVARAAQEVRGRGMEQSAVVFLEGLRPGGGIASSAVAFIRPLLEAVVGTGQAAEAAETFENPAAFELLLEQLKASK